MAIQDFSDAQCLTLVEASPAAVAAHDKAAWLGLFASDCAVEDPVGSRPHDASGLDAFYETFIAPNQIHFEVERDIVAEGHVMRDLTIVIRMSPRVLVRVPVHLLYELVEEGGELKIGRLAAHWELWPMLKQQMASGLSFLGVGCASALRMLRQLGPSGMVGFARAASSVGAGGKERVAHFVEHFNAGDDKALAALFIDAAALEFPRGEALLSPPECVALGGQLHVRKVLVAGSRVTASVSYEHDGVLSRGVAVFDLDPASLLFSRVTCYWA